MGIGQRLKELWVRNTADLSSCEVRVFEALDTLVTPEIAATSGIRPAIAIAKLKTYYMSDSMAKAAVDSIAEQVSGMGFYTTADPVKGTDGRPAKQVIDEFSEEVGLDDWAIESARQLGWAGFCMTKLLTPSKLTNVELVPPESIVAVYREPKTGKFLHWDQRLGGSSGKADPKDVVYIRSSLDSMEPFGVSLLRPLAVERSISYTKGGVVVRTETVPPPLATKAMMEADMGKIFHRYAAPKNIWHFPGLENDKLTNESGKIESMPTDADYATNAKEGFKVTTLEPRIQRGFETFVSFLENRLLEGLQCPQLKLNTTPGFTEASAREATRLAAYKIYTLQRLLKRAIEREFFSRILEQNGIDPLLAKARLFWGPVDRPKLEPSEVLLAYHGNPNRPDLAPVLSREEARKILAKLGWEIPVEQKEVTE